MHIGYPYQGEFIALTKHYRHVSLDLRWAWIINPAAGVRFVTEYLLAAPASKLFIFGGDYIPVEVVYGHSCLVRRGLAQALTELVEESWIALEETPELIERLWFHAPHQKNLRGIFCSFKRPIFGVQVGDFGKMACVEGNQSEIVRQCNGCNMTVLGCCCRTAGGMS